MIDLKKKKIIFFSTDIADIKIANFFKKNGLKIFCFHTNLISYFIGLFIFKKNYISLKKKEYKKNKHIENLAKKILKQYLKDLQLKNVFNVIMKH